MCIRDSFLGLRNLTFAQRMQEAVKEKYQKDIKIEDIPLEDPETIALFAAGNTKGIFQFEQSGAIRLLRRVQPNCFEEIVATTSLNRPGASDYIDNFVKRKHGKEKVDICLLYTSILTRHPWFSILLPVDDGSCCGRLVIHTILYLVRIESLCGPCGLSLIHIFNSAIFSTPAAFKAGFKISGVMISFTNEVTIAPNAAPIITATARSTTFPRRRKAFNSFNIS